MNKYNFLSTVVEKLESMDKKQLSALLIEVARRLPDKERGTLIENLEKIKRDAEYYRKSGSRHFIPQRTIDEKMVEFRKIFTLIEDREVGLEAEGYDEYPNSYWSDDWVWEYSDSDDILPKIKDAIDFAEECVNDLRYQEARELWDYLLTMVVQSINEGEEWELTLSDLIEERLIHCDFKKIKLLALYTIYQTSENSERAKQMFEYIKRPLYRNVEIEEIFKMELEPLPCEAEFWDDWISLLLLKGGNENEQRLDYVLLYCKNAEDILSIARDNYIQHPALYLSALIKYKENGDYQSAVCVGEEAINKIPRIRTIRGKIAMEAADAAEHIGLKEIRDSMWFECFRSDPTVENYLHMFSHKETAAQYKDKLIPEVEKALLRKSQRHLSFFIGRFEQSRKEIELMMLSLYEDSECKKAIKRIGKSVSRDLGIESEFDVFYNRFKIWKDTFPMKPEDKERYITEIEKVVLQRTEDIIREKYREGYGSVARLIAALGEIKESRGMIGEKQRIITQYKKQFPRHIAFHRELKEQMD